MCWRSPGARSAAMAGRPGWTARRWRTSRRGAWSGGLGDWRGSGRKGPAGRKRFGGCGLRRGNAGSIGPWAFCLRDRVAQTAALPVLTPMVEADLTPEQYAYRSGRSAHDAVQRAHRLASTGHCEVVDADWSDDFGQRPHAELLKCVARRVGDGRMVGWVKAWWERAKACSRPRAGCGRPASGSMSGDWKRSDGVERGTGTAKIAGKRLPPPT